MPPVLFFFLKIDLAIPGPKWFHMDLKIVFYIYAKNAIQIW